MPINIDRLLVESAYKLTSGARNEYGDYQFGVSSDAIPCLYEDISTLGQTPIREGVTIDGILWFGTTTTPQLGDIYQVNAVNYQIKHINRAKRRLKDNSTQFFSCEVKRVRQIS